MAKLTEKQKAFADYYIETLNATESAKKAGYSKKSAEVIGFENLRKPKIEKYIQKRLEKKESERIASQDEVLEYLTGVMRTEQEETKERTKAARLLGKRYAIFTDRVEKEISGPGGGAIEISAKEELEKAISRIASREEE